jgi:hypothetical protein
MHLSQKKKVVIASILKPVDDTRLYEKLGRTLSATGRYECHIIGIAGGTVNDVIPHLFPMVNRLSFARIARPFTILNKIINIQPDILIIGTHELLFTGLLYKILTHKQVIYDVQENYYLNIIHTNAFPRFFRRPLANWVRLKENTLGRFIDFFLLAERGFVHELGFTRHRSVVIENKVIIPEGFLRQPKDETIELLFSGTIDESTGVYEAISLARRLHSYDDRYSLHIIGYCARKWALDHLNDMIAPFPFIRLTGGDTLQPHSKIMRAIGTASFGLVLYRPSPHINNRMPTKLYEYMACRLPILIRKDLWWCELVTKAHAGVAVDVENVEVGELDDALKSESFYPAAGRNLSYEFDRHGLVDVFDQLMSENISPRGSASKLNPSA